MHSVHPNTFNTSSFTPSGWHNTTGEGPSVPRQGGGRNGAGNNHRRQGPDPRYNNNRGQQRSNTSFAPAPTARAPGRGGQSQRRQPEAFAPRNNNHHQNNHNHNHQNNPNHNNIRNNHNHNHNNNRPWTQNQNGIQKHPHNRRNNITFKNLVRQADLLNDLIRRVTDRDGDSPMGDHESHAPEVWDQILQDRLKQNTLLNQHLDAILNTPTNRIFDTPPVSNNNSNNRNNNNNKPKFERAPIRRPPRPVQIAPVDEMDWEGI